MVAAGETREEALSPCGLADMSHRPVRVLHFVTGGFSGGATQVAIALTEAGVASDGRIEPLLVLRRKRHTDPARIAELKSRGVPVEVVPGWTHWASIFALASVCRRFRPDVLVAHGFSEHLWGRYAGLLAGVPALVHVEHNTRERYTAWRRAQSRWLAARTARIVGCSEGVRESLLKLGMPPERTVAIPNGIRLAPFEQAPEHPWRERTPGIVMVSRYSRQKDHATLLRALAILATQGHRPPLLLAGDGKALHRQPVERLASELGLGEQVKFLGLCRNVPELLMTHQIAVLSTHYEGMPLALIEGMAAGCAVIGSDVPGVREVIHRWEDGLLVPESDPTALADALRLLLEEPQTGERLAAAARRSAIEHYSRERMHQRYEALFLELGRQPQA
jgi:glycosyltransferase involved in cell wall biosynthesis